jgi:hypothetical protein
VNYSTFLAFCIFFLSPIREKGKFRCGVYLISTVEFAMPGSLPAPDLQIQATKVEKEDDPMIKSVVLQPVKIDCFFFSYSLVCEF